MTILIAVDQEIIFKVIADFFEEQGMKSALYNPENIPSGATCLLTDCPSKERDSNLSIPVIILDKKTSPISLEELFNRYQEKIINVRLDVFLVGSYKISTKVRQAVHVDLNTILSLTEKEVMILEMLYQSKTPLSKEKILRHVWGYESGIDTHTLETHIYKLRKKLSPESPEALILTLQEGYALTCLKS